MNLVEVVKNDIADYLNCPTIWGSGSFDFAQAKNIYGVGGTVEQYTSYLTKLISGTDRYSTNQAVLDFIKATVTKIKIGKVKSA